jgi:hypothetical protein
MWTVRLCVIYIVIVYSYVDRVSPAHYHSFLASSLQRYINTYYDKMYTADFERNLGIVYYVATYGEGVDTACALNRQSPPYHARVKRAARHHSRACVCSTCRLLPGTSRLLVR